MGSFKDIIFPDMTESEYLKLPHTTKYEKIIEALGYENVKSCIPFELDKLKEAYKTDPNFNNLSLRTWDFAAGYTGGPSRCDFVGNRLTHLYNTIGVTRFSCSEGICILKTCALMWISEKGE